MNFSINQIITIICLIFILFVSLIFYEIIEINCFGLSYNTKRNIMKRERNEKTDSIIDENSEYSDNIIDLIQFKIYEDDNFN